MLLNNYFFVTTYILYPVVETVSSFTTEQVPLHVVCITINVQK